MDLLEPASRSSFQRSSKGIRMGWSFLMLILLVSVGTCPNVQAQRTSLDEVFGSLYRSFRLMFVNVLTGLTSSNNIQLLQRDLKLQQSNSVDRNLTFCDVRNGPGRRSEQPPISVHRLRPGDVDIVGALGDSLTAGNAILGTSILDNVRENRGIAWSIGGQGNWRTYLTLPNILKKFNKNLYGYSTADGISTDISSRFNVAELGAMSRDIPYMSRVLVQRFLNDPRVNMTHHWKLITLFIGCNDFCSDMCFLPDPSKAIDLHELDMIRTLRYLRDNVPRLMVNIIPTPNLSVLGDMRQLPPHCQTTLRFECPCIVGRSRTHIAYMDSLMKQWYDRDLQIASRDEFNTDSFTVNAQTFSGSLDYPTYANGSTDYSFSSYDCFHLSQKGQAMAAHSLWNNMLEFPGEKSKFIFYFKQPLKCPTKERPYLITRTNSQPNFVV